MSKVDREQDGILYEGSWLTVRAVTLPGGGQPAKKWVNSLDKKGLARFKAACAIVETSFSSGRPTAGRTEKIPNSREGVSELKVTKPGSTPPHLRAFFVRDGRTLWLATGITKKSNKLKQRDIDEADRVVAVWRGAQG